MSLRYQTDQHWADALAHLKRLSGMDIAPDGTAINPATGQRQMVYARSPLDALTEDYSDFRFDNPGFGYGSMAGLAPGYYKDNDATTFDNFMERAITGGLMALGGVAGAGLAGFGPGAATAAELGGAVGSSGLGGGVGVGAGGGEAVLGSGLTAGAGGVTGLTPGAAGASGISTAGASGALAPGFFASEAAYPVLGGLSAGAGAAALGSASAGAGSGVGGGAATGAATAGGATAAGRILRGEGTLEDYLSVGGTLGATGLSIYGNNQIADRYEGLANQYMGLGAPSRARYEHSFSPNFKVTDIPGLQDAMDTSSQSVLRQLSAKDGNPFGNPGGLAEAMKYVTGNVTLPALQNYRNQNAATGGFGAFSTAAPQAAGNSISTSGNMYSDIGRGLGNIANPPTSLDQLLRQMRGTGASLA